MRSLRLLVSFSALALLAALPVDAARLEAATAVSPGGAGQYLTIDAACPTFSWAAVAGAEGYELRIYAADEETGRLDTTRPVVEAAIPGSATSWTPAAADCLASGGRYAWRVRPAEERAEWSAQRLFAVDAGPRLAELKQALREVLEEMVEEGRLGEGDAIALERGFGAAAPGLAVASPDVARADRPAESTAAFQQIEDEAAAAQRESKRIDSSGEGSTDGPEGVAEAPEELLGADAALGTDLHLENGGVDKVLLDSLDGSGTGADLRMRHNNGDLTVELDSDLGTAGASLALFALDNDGTGTALSVRIDSEGTASEGGGAIRLWGQNPTGTTNPRTVEIRSTEGASDGGSLRLFKADGVTVGIDLDAELGGAGGDSRVTTGELSITGGSDLSEQFRVVGDRPAPGMVLSIGGAGGELRISEMAYDPAVLGVVSGAGGLKPGMMMGQAGSVADGEVAVALAGRVYVLADASQLPIRPGDLLTSSDVAGHAMRVSDPGRGHGTVLGKAMTGLEAGRGLVLVLVALQ